MNLPVFKILTTIAVSTALLPSIASAQFHLIGSFDSQRPTARVRDMTPDGSVILGADSGKRGTDWTWTVEGGFSQLSVPGAVVDWVGPNALSDDGTVLLMQDGSRAFRWDESNGFDELEFPPSASGMDIHSMSISGDGTVVGGALQDGFQVGALRQGVIWTEDGSETIAVGNQVKALSADGSVAALDGVIWKSGAFLETGVETTWAISADGSVVAGYTSAGTSFTATIWSADGGTIDLGVLPEHSSSSSHAITSNGKVVVGSSKPENRFSSSISRAFIWDPVHGMRDLEDLLTDDLDMISLHPHGLSIAIGISDDLRRIAGETWYRDGEDTLHIEPWLIASDIPIGAITGDTDFDFDVDFADFVSLSQSYGKPGIWEQGDFDANGQVGFGDFVLLSENYGIEPRGNASPAAVPEPSGAWMLCQLLIFLGCIVRRVRKTANDE